MKVKKKITRQEALELDKFLDAVDQNGQFTKAVQEKITNNKFELADVVEANEKYHEAMKAEFYKSIDKTEKDIQGLPEDEKKEIAEDHQRFASQHGGYYDFLKEEVTVNFDPIYLKDLKSCNYKPSLFFPLKDKIFFKEKPTVKASASK